MKRILFTGGGSAGHVVPNLALMNEMKYSASLAYMGTGGIEKGLVTNAGYRFFEVDCPKLVRSLTPKNLLIPFSLHRAVKRARLILKEWEPDLVFSKGGFASYPAAKAAFSLKIPVYTHESDLTPGLCTKLIAKRCKAVFTSFPETASRFANGKCVGSPIRREILCGEKSRARAKYGFSGRKPVLLVLGGGSGSRTLNEAVERAFPQILSAFDVLLIAGKGNAMKNPPEGVVQREFEQDMGSAYAAADLVLCRAGSNTVFELLTLKKPAVLVPLQKNSRGDQLQNALYFEKQGLCKVLCETELSKLPEILLATHRDAALHKALDASNFHSATGALVALLKS